jgi:hypothetical protein
MRPIRWLEKKLGRYAIPNLMLYVIVGQIAVMVFQLARPGVPQQIFSLIPALVMQGEVWRLVTFLIDWPAQIPLLFLPFYWLILHMMGTALEQTWGVFRLNLFVFTGYLLTLVAAFAAYPFDRDLVATNYFLYTALFLAFARYHPEMEFRLFFVLPIKVKWLAYMYWAKLALMAYSGGPGILALVLAIVLNYFLFFWREQLEAVKYAQRRRNFEAKAGKGRPKLVHTCHTCGLTSKDAPRTTFRYCSQCAGQICYCPDHLRSHEHVVER